MRLRLLQTILIPVFFIFSFHFSNADTLLDIGGNKVSTKEFEYIYKKNNMNGEADFSKASLENYLKLFVNYKLKVQEAHDLGLDTVTALMEEYNGYKKQLLETHIQRMILDPLVKQEYERSKKDIEVAHIFVSKNAPNSEAKINEAYQKLQKGQSFEKVVAAYSEDSLSALKGGVIGYFTALQMGYPQIEDAVYQTSLGKYSSIIQTDLGYHIIRPLTVRPARGSIKVSIIKMTKPSDDESVKVVKNLIDSVYHLLQNGANFAELAMKYSDDPYTRERAGEMDWFGINRYVKTFEDAAFSLKKDGDITPPFSTATSFYIIKRMMASQSPTYKEAEPVIKTKVLHSKMYADKMDDFYEQIKQKSGFKLFPDNVQKFKGKALAVVDKYPFVYPQQITPLTIFSLSGKNYNENEVAELMKENYSNVTGSLGEERLNALIEASIHELLLNAYEKSLIDTNFEYSSLLDEYKNGVLIFELTKEKVWNKAMSDTVGLQSFYDQMGDKYMWNTRAETIEIQPNRDLSLSDLQKMIKKNKLQTLDDWKKYLSSDSTLQIKVSSQMIEKDVSPNSGKLDWKKGVYQTDGNNFYQVVNILPPQKKSLSDVRGYVVSAYQEYLEKKWLEDLHAKYKVELHQKEFDKLVK